MWWQETTHFLATEWVHFKTLETASWKAFRNDRVRTTRDWLDFSVEHLSVFWKHFQQQQQSAGDDDVVFHSIATSLDTYVINAKPLAVPLDSAPPSTIAILPFLVSTNSRHANRTAHDFLPKKALTATLASLWQIGIGRAVVVGPSIREYEIAQDAIHSLLPKRSLRAMELAFVLASSTTEHDRKVMPRVALSGLQRALRGTMSSAETSAWLGPDPEKWAFVYYTEPDLILHARQSAMMALTRAMRNGHTLSAHRFQPVPHQRSFPGYHHPDKVLPDEGTFSMWTEMDPLLSDHSCCDAGKHYPSNPSKNSTTPLRNKECGWNRFWWQCGFFGNKVDYSDPDTVRELHKRLINYPFYVLKGGTGFPLVDNHQRTCLFRKQGQCE
jgi:hypothetical protein